jgi:hypothetical protein
MRRYATGLVVACLALLAAPSAGLAGPVILGGDDLTQHGSVDAAGNPQEGWLYIQRALENISPRVTRLNDNTVAAIGSSPASAGNAGDAGAAIGVAASRARLGVTYHDGSTAIDAFFRRLRNGEVRPRIVWLAGAEGENDLGSCTSLENQAVTRNAETIDNFVTTGGGLLTHGTCYEWVRALLPGLQAVPYDDDFDSDLYLTPQGQGAFPGLTNSDVNGGGRGPWHNYFQGDLGGLQPLVRSAKVDDATGQDAAVIIGGAAATIRIPPRPTCVNPTVVRDRRVRLAGGGQAVLATRQFTDAATPFRASVRLSRGQFATGVTYVVNGKLVATNVSPRTQVRVPANVLLPGRRRNRMDAYVAFAGGRVVRITQLFVIVRCSVPRVSCRRASARSLRCSSRTPLGVRRVTVSAASPAGGSATGATVVRRGRYTVTLRSRVSLPRGRYTYRHVGRTRKRGERMVMIRYVNVA